MWGVFIVIIVLCLYAAIRILTLKNKTYTPRYDPDITKIDYCKLHTWNYSTELGNYICTVCGYISGNKRQDDQDDDSY